MKYILQSALIITFLCLSNILVAQRGQSDLIDLFYEILISGEEFNNSDREPIVVNSEDAKISPESLISKYPDVLLSRKLTYAHVPKCAAKSLQRLRI